MLLAEIDSMVFSMFAAVTTDTCAFAQELAELLSERTRALTIKILS